MLYADGQDFLDRFYNSVLVWEHLRMPDEELEGVAGGERCLDFPLPVDGWMLLSFLKTTVSVEPLIKKTKGSPGTKMWNGVS